MGLVELFFAKAARTEMQHVHLPLPWRWPHDRRVIKLWAFFHPPEHILSSLFMLVSTEDIFCAVRAKYLYRLSNQAAVRDITRGFNITSYACSVCLPDRLPTVTSFRSWRWWSRRPRPAQ